MPMIALLPDVSIKNIHTSMLPGYILCNLDLHCHALLISDQGSRQSP